MRRFEGSLRSNFQLFLMLECLLELRLITRHFHLLEEGNSVSHRNNAGLSICVALHRQCTTYKVHFPIDTRTLPQI
jgi:hypothetical protein